MQHPLGQQLNYIRTALGQDKRPIGFLLGAGAPMSLKKEDGNPLIPDLIALTDQVKAKTNKETSDLIDKLLIDLENSQATLEDLLGYIRLLTAIPGEKDVRGFDLSKLRAADHEICKQVKELVSVSLPEVQNSYHALALWLGSVGREMPVQLFTTNYDLLIEQALEQQHVPYFDGFMGSYKPLFDLEAMEEDSIPRRWVRLWKLHGSANWQKSSDGKIWRGTQESGVDETVLIYPSHLKYDQSRRLPYLAMMDRMKGFLKQPNAVLLTTGFAFRDQHINEVLVQSLRTNQTASIQAMIHGELDNYEECLSMAATSPNLTMLAVDGAVVGTRKGIWMPTKDPETGQEVPTNFAYGDFKQFGDLLIEIIGKSEPINVEAEDDI